MKEWQRQMFGKEMADMFPHSPKQKHIESKKEQPKEDKQSVSFDTTIIQTPSIPFTIPFIIPNNDSGFNGFNDGSGGGGGASGSW